MTALLDKARTKASAISLTRTVATREPSQSSLSRPLRASVNYRGAVFPVTTRDCGDGWHEAEVSLSRYHPLTIGTGKSPESALKMLRSRVALWGAA